MIEAHRGLVLGLVLVLALAGCQSAATEIPVETPTLGETSIELPTAVVGTFVSPLAFDSPLPTPTIPGPTPVAPIPSRGKGVVRGGLFSTTTSKAIADTSVYLIHGVGPRGDEMPPVWPGPVEGDVRGRTDAQGWFVITDVPPGVYYVAIWAPLDYVILDEYRDGVRQPTALNVQADRVLDLGYVVISWP